MRALLGTASHICEVLALKLNFCEVVVLKLRTPWCFGSRRPRANPYSGLRGAFRWPEDLIRMSIFYEHFFGDLWSDFKRKQQDLLIGT